jgi:single-strand DNA-binding protein
MTTMAGETVITVIGNFTADPEIRFTEAGTAVANFVIASTPRTFDRESGQWRDGEALFLRCTAWRALAETAAETLFMWIFKLKQAFGLLFSDVDMSLTNQGV